MATAPGAQLLALTSSSTLHRPRYLRSQISSGYIAIRLKRHQGHSARSPVAHFDELLLFTWTSSSKRLYLTSSSKQLYLKSPYYLHGRALPNSLPNELFQAALHDELFPTVYLTSSSQQLYLTSSYYSHGRALPNGST